MSLSSHLDDLMDDLPGSPEIGLESIRVNNVTLETSKGEGKTRTSVKLNKDFCKKLNILYDTIRIKSAMEKLDVVDYQMALEAMTAMDDIVTTRAKLTKTPSKLNKAIMVSELSNVSDDLPEQYLERVTELLTLLTETQDSRRELMSTVTELGLLFYKELERFNNNPPIVIDEGESVNLFTDSLLKICGIDDTKLEYEKYSGTLVQKFHWLIGGDVIDSIRHFRRVQDIEQSVASEAENELETTDEEKDLVENLTSVIDEDTNVGSEHLTEVINSNDEDFSLETVTRLALASIERITRNSVSIDSFSKSLTVLMSEVDHNVANGLPTKLKSEVYAVIKDIPEIYQQTSDMLDTRELLLEQDNDVEKLLRLLKFLD